jgi:uncharacterized damage-inducible protein DinB
MGKKADSSGADMKTKRGRPRHYPDTAYEGFAVAEVGYHAADLAELHERVYDQIDDLPSSAINFVAPKTSLTIGWLAMHMVVAEVMVISQVSGQPVPESIAANPNYANMSPYGEPPAKFGSAGSIIELGREVLAEFTIPAMRNFPGITAPSGLDRLPTIREVLRHLAWHWAYHSGQIGLVRLQWGSEYEWTFPS